ncbi:MAG: acyltransferase domain-containing protein [Planctomycetia bacterium]|nr:acyltransferase domain-containing protein [Planctomycetia bacterium]
MAGDWVDAQPRAAELFSRASAILGYDLLAVCRSGPAQRLNTTAVSQPAILVTSLAALETLRSREGHPLDAATVTAGLSLGEYTALVFAGALDFDDAVRLVDIRGRGMQECAEQRPGSMLAVLGVDREKLTALCDECRDGDVLEVANVLCPGNIVVSGSAEACRRLDAAAVAAGAIKCVPLEVAGAFHTALMQPAVERLTAALAATQVRTPRIPVVSNVDARPHTDPDEIRRLLARQVVGVVEWNASMAYILSTGVRSIWEVGPGRVLRGLMKRIDRGVACSGVFD